jgi:Leucine-rich repeat (LRR) protein
MNAICQLPVLNMALLTKLTELSTGGCELSEATVLSLQLQRLHIHTQAGAHSMAPVTRLELKQLQHLSVRVDFEQPQLLLQLAQLPALTHLALQYDEYCVGQATAATASTWPLLPQLRELEIAHAEPPSQPQWEAILAGVAAAAGLTKLTLDARMTDTVFQDDFLPDDGDNDVGVRWASEVAACARLAKLACLQDLTVGGSEAYHQMILLPGDAPALTALSRLTCLDLAMAKHGVETAAATALARSLQQLQSLDLSYCCLQLGSAEGSACLEAIGRLTQLTRLSLDGNEGLMQHGLMQLTGLSCLDQQECYDLCSDLLVTDPAAMTTFWAFVHAQRL